VEACSSSSETPGGTATFRLPENVVTKAEFDSKVQALQNSVNAVTARANTLASDITSVRGQVNTVSTAVTSATQQVTKLRTDTGRQLGQIRRTHKASINKLRKDQSSQAMNNMLITMMMQQQVQGQIEGHQHTIARAAITGNADPVSTSTPTGGGGGGNTALMFLPMMMMGQDGGGGDNNMMMMVMMMMIAQGNR